MVLLRSFNEWKVVTLRPIQKNAMRCNCLQLSSSSSNSYMDAKNAAGLTSVAFGGAFLRFLNVLTQWKVWSIWNRFLHECGCCYSSSHTSFCDPFQRHGHDTWIVTRISHWRLSGNEWNTSDEKIHTKKKKKPEQIITIISGFNLCMSLYFAETIAGRGRRCYL